MLRSRLKQGVVIAMCVGEYMCACPSMFVTGCAHMGLCGWEFSCVVLALSRGAHLCLLSRSGYTCDVKAPQWAQHLAALPMTSPHATACRLRLGGLKLSISPGGGDTRGGGSTSCLSEPQPSSGSSPMYRRALRGRVTGGI